MDWSSLYTQTHYSNSKPITHNPNLTFSQKLKNICLVKKPNHISHLFNPTFCQNCRPHPTDTTQWFTNSYLRPLFLYYLVVHFIPSKNPVNASHNTHSSKVLPSPPTSSHAQIIQGSPNLLSFFNFTILICKK